MFDTLRDNSKVIVYIVVFAFVISGGFMGFGAYLSNRGGGGQAPNQKAGVIAEVNDQEISQQEYFSLLQQQAPQSNLNSRQIIPFRYNVLDALIERKLVILEAEKMEVEVEVSESEIDAQYNNILEQNEMTDQELGDNLAEQGYTIGQLRDDIKSSLKNSKLITETIDQAVAKVEVSSEEVQDLYQQRYPEEKKTAKDNQEKDQAAETEKRPEFAEVKSDLETEIRNQKRNQAVNEWMQGLKADAEININDPVLSAYHALENENYAQAAAGFSSFVEEEETDPIFYSYLAQAYEGQNNYEQAEEVYQNATAKYPENIDIRFNFAQYLKGQNKDQAAVNQLDQISSLADDDFMTHYQLFMMYNQLGAEEKAEKSMKKIKELSSQMQNSSESPLGEKAEDIEQEAAEIEEEIEVENNLEENN